MSTPVRAAGPAPTTPSLGGYRLALLASLVIPTAVFVAVAFSTRSIAFDEAAKRLERAAQIGAEQAARVVETNEVISRLVETRVAGPVERSDRRGARGRLRDLASGHPRSGADPVGVDLG